MVPTTPPPGETIVGTEEQTDPGAVFPAEPLPDVPADAYPADAQPIEQGDDKSE